MGAPLAEWVPNVSLGRDPARLRELVAEISATGAWVLDHSADVDHNRAVVTCVASLSVLAEASFRAVAFAIEHVDLTRHAGVHPRIGACDVCPFVPLAGTTSLPGRSTGATTQECVALAHELGRRVGSELALPVLYYGEAAADRRTLPFLRREAALLTPDAGPKEPHPTAGRIAIGVRPFLIAFNVQLAASDLDIARRIARAIRESNGGLPGIRALAFPLAEAGVSQVSMNVCDFERTGLEEVFVHIEGLARECGATVLGSELVGLAPRAALDERIAARVRLKGFDPGRQVFEEVLERVAPKS